MTEPDPRDVVTAVLPKSWSQTKKDNLADEVLEALDTAGLLNLNGVFVVSPEDAKVPVETIEAYGLTIKLDALGDASEISSQTALQVLG